jgi:hypothetical protein
VKNKVNNKKGGYVYEEAQTFSIAYGYRYEPGRATECDRRRHLHSRHLAISSSAKGKATAAFLFFLFKMEEGDK